MGFFDQNPTNQSPTNTELNPLNIIQSDIQIPGTNPIITTEVSTIPVQGGDIGNIDAILSEVNSLMTSSVLPGIQKEVSNPTNTSPEMNFLSGFSSSSSINTTPASPVQENINMNKTESIVQSTQNNTTTEPTIVITNTTGANQEVIPSPVINVVPQTVTDVVTDTTFSQKIEEKVDTISPPVTSFFQTQKSEPISIATDSKKEENKSLSSVLEDSKLSPISDELRQIIIHLHNERKTLEGALTKDVKEKESIEQKIADKQIQLSKLRAKIEIVEKAQAFIGNQAEEEKRVIL